MHWEERLLALFDDLEQQAEGLALAARDAEVAELGRAEYAQVELSSRVHGSQGRRLALVVDGVGRLDVELVRAGSDWCLVRDRLHEWLVRLAAVTRVSGLADRATDARHRSLGARLGFGSALRGIAEDGPGVLVYLRDGSNLRGTVQRVGADFLEVRGDADGTWAGATTVEVTPFDAVVAVRRT